MDGLSNEDILSLCERNEDYQVSIYMSTGVGSAKTKQYPLILKSLIKEAYERLISLDVTREKAKKILEEVSNLADNSAFWMSQKQGLSIFISIHEIKYFLFPIGFKESVTVSNYYNILPILDFLFTDNNFYILALNYNGSKLYQANKYDIKEITTKEMAKSLREVKSVYEREESNFFHIAKDGSDKSSENIIFHGRGGLKEDDKMRVRDLIRQLEKKVSSFIKDSDLPLVLAGTDFVVAEYRKLNSYKNLLEASVLINIDPTNEKKIYDQALKLIEKTYEANKENELQRYFDLKNDGKASNNPSEILRIAYTGGIRTLFLNEDKNLFNGFSEKSELTSVGNLSKNIYCPYANLLSILTVKNGGKVIILGEDRIPEKSLVAANFRY